MFNRRRINIENAAERKRHGGYALVGLLTLLPALVSIFLVTAALSLLFREHTRTQGICKNHLFHAQDQISNELNKLMELNPQALKLRAQEKRAQLSLQMAILSGNPTRIAMAEARLVQVQLARASLDIKQRNILISAEAIAQTSTVRMRHELRQQKTRIQLGGLAVGPDIAGDVAPVYKTANNFHQAQMAKAHYEWHMPEWFTWKKQQQTRFQFSCAVTIEERATQYRATLAEGA